MLPNQTYIQNNRKDFWLLIPTQLFTQGQWWSILAIQAFHWLQWWDFGGLRDLHFLHLFWKRAIRRSFSVPVIPLILWVSAYFALNLATSISFIHLHPQPKIPKNPSKFHSKPKKHLQRPLQPLTTLLWASLKSKSNFICCVCQTAQGQLNWLLAFSTSVSSLYSSYLVKST